MKACFMGLGYIGLPTAIIAAKHGVKITGVDINPKVVEMTSYTGGASSTESWRLICDRIHFSCWNDRINGKTDI